MNAQPRLGEAPAAARAHVHQESSAGEDHPAQVELERRVAPADGEVDAEDRERGRLRRIDLEGLLRRRQLDRPEHHDDQEGPGHVRERRRKERSFKQSVPLVGQCLR